MKARVPIKQPATIRQLRIVLGETKPPIWRRILVPADINLHDLHVAIQRAMGWYGCHLHEFRIGDMSFADHTVDVDLSPDILDENQHTLARVLAVSGKKQFRYDYDFGDGWNHQVYVQKLTVADPKLTYPRCIDGARNCPPEDCGGVGGYYRLLSILKNPRHPEYRDMRRWLGGPYDPDRFSTTEANQRIRLKI